MVTDHSSSLRVLVYSDDRTVREAVRLTLGRRVAADLPELEVFEVATQAAVLKALDAGGYDLCIFDGEAVPSGGIGLCHQVKDEIADCPPVIVILARVADAWLATWSEADGVASHPVDPVRLPQVVADVLRRPAAATA